MLLPFPRGLPGITPEDAAKVVRRRIAALGGDVFYRNLMLQLELGCSGCIRLRAEVPNKVQSQRWCVRGRVVPRPPPKRGQVNVVHVSSLGRNR